MKRLITNKLKMYNAVIEVCREHQTAWESVPGYVSTLEEFEARVAVLRDRSGIQSTVTSGISAFKRDRLEHLYEHLLIVQGALWVYANGINDFLLMDRNHITISELKRLSIVRLDLHLSAVRSDLEAHGPALEAYGVTPAYLQEAIALINEGGASSTRPRMAILERKMMTQSMNVIHREIDTLLKFRLDKLMRIFKTSQPDFYNRYFNARLVVDHRGPTAGVDPDPGT